MDFDFSTLITDRAPSDLELLRDLLSTPMSDWTAEQLAAFNQAASKGAYNYTDLNRVTACMDYLNERLTALGYEFLDASENSVGIDADALKDVARIRTDHVMPELEECSFRVACDVTNPLCGPNGATFIYGPQKGVTEEMKEKLDQDLGHFAEVTKRCLGADCADMEGAGAAGGLGYAFMAYLKADLRPGIDLVLEAVDMNEAMKGADLVFTGEGRLDHQTAMGKAPVGIAALAKKHGAAVIAFAGSVADGAEACNEKGIDAYFPILRQVVTLDEAMEPQRARQNMAKTAEQVMRLVEAVRR